MQCNTMMTERLLNKRSSKFEQDKKNAWIIKGHLLCKIHFTWCLDVCWQCVNTTTLQ